MSLSHLQCTQSWAAVTLHGPWLGTRGQWPRLGPHRELPGLPHSMEPGFQEPPGRSGAQGIFMSGSQCNSCSVLLVQQHKAPPSSRGRLQRHQLSVRKCQGVRRDYKTDGDPVAAVSGENKLLHQDSCTKPTYSFRLLSPSPDISAGASSRVKIVYWNFSK